MANGNQLEPAGTEHVTNTVVGMVVGGLAAGALVVAAPVLLPAIGLAAVGTAGVALIGGIPWLGAAVGGWVGYNKAQSKAMKYGVRK